MTPLIPILNRWALSQEQAAFGLLQGFLQGQDVDNEHPLKMFSGEKLSWRLVSLYSLWQPIIEQVYNGYYKSGKKGARMAIMVLCTTGGDLRLLFSRYDPNDTLGLFKRL